MSSPSLHFKLIDTFPLSCFFIDNEYNILHCNSLGLEMLNSCLTEIKNQSIAIHFPEIDFRIDQEVENYKTLFVDKKGQKSDVIVKYAPINDGSYCRILYIIEHSELNQLIIEKQKFIETILDSIPADIAVFDKNHSYLYVNPNGIRDIETRKWMIGKSDFDYCNYKSLDKSFAQTRRDHFNKALQTKQEVEWLEEFQEKNTHIIRRLYPVFFGETFLYMIGYGINISELKLTQKSLISNELRNQNILNSALDAVVVISPDGKITFWNAQAEIIFGWKSEEILGKILGDIIVPERFRKTHEAGIKNHSAGLGGATANKIIEFPALNRNNEEFPIEFSILPIYDKGIVINYCSFIRDISLRKNKEFEICQQNKS